MTGRGKGGKGLGKGGAKRHRKVLRDNIQVSFSDIDIECPCSFYVGHYQACNPATCKKGWCQADQWSHLRRDQGCSEGDRNCMYID